MLKLRKILGIFVISLLLPITLLFLQLVIQKPMPLVEDFNLYIQPILWGLLFDIFVLIIFGIIYLFEYLYY